MKTSQGLFVLAALLVPLMGQAQVSPEDSRAQFDAQMEQVFRNQRAEMQKNQQRLQRQQQEQPINERLYADVRSLLTSAKDLTREALHHPQGKRIEGYTDSTLADDLASVLIEGRLGDAEAAIETLGREAGAGDKTIFYLVHARAALLSILEKVKAAGPTPSHQPLCRKAEKEIKELIDGITMAIERYHASMKR